MLIHQTHFKQLKRALHAIFASGCLLKDVLKAAVWVHKPWQAT